MSQSDNYKNISNIENSTEDSVFIGNFNTVTAMPRYLLPRYVSMMTACDEPIALFGGFTFGVVGASMVITKNNIDKTIETVELKFRTTNESAVNEILKNPHAYIISTPAHGCIAFGEYEPPFPKVSAQVAFDNPGGTPGGWDVEISLTAPFATYRPVLA